MPPAYFAFQVDLVLPVGERVTRAFGHPVLDGDLALEGRPEKEEPAIVAEAPEPTLDHIDLVLDPDHPERSRAIVYLPRPPDAEDDDD